MTGCERNRPKINVYYFCHAKYQWPFNCELVNFFLSGVINYYSIKINMKVFIETKETTGQIFIYRCQSV